MSLPLKKNFIANKVASELSGYSTDYIARLCREGKIGGAQVGRGWVVDKESLERFIRQQEDRKKELARELSRSREREYKSRQSARFLAGFSTCIARENTPPVNHARPEPRVRRFKGPRLSDIHPVLRGGFAFAVTSLVIMAAILTSESSVIDSLAKRFVVASMAIHTQERPLPEQTVVALYRVGDALENGTMGSIAFAPQAYHETVLALATTPADVAPAAAIAPTTNTSFSQMLALMSDSFSGFIHGVRDRIASALGFGATQITIVPFESATFHPSSNVPAVETAGGTIALAPTKEAITTVVTSGVSPDYVQSYVSSYVTQALAGLSSRIGAQVLDGQYVHPSFAIGPAGSEQTNPHITFDTTPTTTNGLTSTLDITASNNAIHFVPSTSGTLTLAGGGTGTTTWYSGGLVFSDGTKLTQSSTAGYTALYWDNTTSRLGIGTTTPANNLVVSSSGTPVFALNSDNASNGQAEIHFDVAGVVKNYIWQEYQPGNGANDIAIGDGSGATAFRVGSYGDVSIGGLVPGFDYATSTRALNIVGFGNTSSTYTAFLENHSGSPLFAVRDDGNVGIGTSTPWGQLAVNPNGVSGPEFVVGSSSATHLIVTNGGNVGIGTTQPQAPLDVRGNLFVRNADGVVGSHDGVEIATDASAPRVSLVQGGRYVGLFSGDAPGNTYLKNVAGGDWIFTGGAGGNTELARLTNSGTFGIGTTSPSATFAVNGNGYISGNLTVGNNLTIANGNIGLNGSINSNLVPAINKSYDLGSPSFFWRNGYIDSLTVNNLGAASTTISGTASQSFTINSANGTADTQDMQLIFFRGVVVPNAVLSWNHALARFEFNQPAFIQNQSSSTTIPTLALQASGSQTADVLDVLNSSGSNLLAVTASGNIGIGTTTPQANLHIVNTGTPASLTLESTSGNARFQLKNGAGNFWNILTQSSDSALRFQYNGTTAFFLNAAGDGSIGSVNSLALFNIASTTTTQPFLNVGNVSNVYFAVANNGFVGVSSTTPWAQLSVNPTSALNGAPEFVVGSSTVTHFIVTGAGNVGIGTTSPVAPLTIQANANNAQVIRIEPSAGNQFNSYLFFSRGDGFPNSGLVLGNGSDAATIGITNASTIRTAGGLFENIAIQPGINANTGARGELQLVPTGTGGGKIAIGATGAQALVHIASSSPVTDLLRVDGASADAFLVAQNGNIGVGSSSPWALLSVNPTATVGNGPILAVGSSTKTLLELNNNGSFLYGTTTQRTNGFNLTDVNGSARTLWVVNDQPTGIPLDLEETNGGIGQQTNIHFDAGDANGMSAITYASIGSVVTNNTPNSWKGDFAISTINGNSSNEVVRFTSSGNVGIGTSTPSNRLTLNAGVGAPDILSINRSGTGGTAETRYQNNFDTGGFDVGLLGDGTNNFYIHDISDNTNILKIDDGARANALTIRNTNDANGTIGIGTTTPFAQFAVTGLGTGTGYTFLAADANNVPKFVIQDNGNVGIGSTTAPKVNLHVASGSAGGYPSYVAGSDQLLVEGASNALIHTLGASNGTTGIEFDTPTQRAAGYVLYANSTNKLSLGTNNTDRLVIDTSGNVGIGTTSPLSPLSVQSTDTTDGQFRIGYDSDNFARVTVTSAGLLSFAGTTTSASAAGPTDAVNFNFRQVNAGLTALNLGSPGTGYPGVGYNVNFASTNNYTYRGGDAAFLMQLGANGGDSFGFFTAPVGVGGTAISFSNPLLVSSATTTITGRTLISNNLSTAQTIGNARALTLNETSATVGSRTEIGLGYRAPSSYPVTLGEVETAVGTFTTGDFYVATRNTTNDAAPTERLYITSAGNVGIGTTTPSNKLLVQGGTSPTAILAPSVLANAAIVGDNFQTLGSGSGRVYGVVGLAGAASEVSGDKVYGGYFRVQTSAASSAQVGLHAETSSTGSAATIGEFYSNGNPVFTIGAGGAATLGNSGTSVGSLTINGTGDSTTNTLLTFSKGSFGSSNFTEFYNGSGNAGVGINSALFANINGNVGVGTSSPSTTFSTVGNGYFTGTLGVGVSGPVNGENLTVKRATTTGNIANFINQNTEGLYIYQIGNTPTLGTTNSSVLSSTFSTGGSYRALGLATADTVRLSIDTSGNVGIGTTGTTYPLELDNTSYSRIFIKNPSGNGTAAIGVQQNSGDGTSGHNFYTFGVDGNSTDGNGWGLSNNTGNFLFNTFYSGGPHTIWGATAGSQNVFFNGTVGIGSTSPTQLLTVSGTTGTFGIQVDSATNGSPSVKFSNNSGGLQFVLDSSKNFALNDYQLGGTKIFVSSTGNVGIGNYFPSSNLPQNKLSVNGSVSIGYATNADVAAPSNSLIVNGSVGIGTTSPAAALHVQKNTGGGSSYSDAQAVFSPLTSGDVYGARITLMRQNLSLTGFGQLGFASTTDTGLLTLGSGGGGGKVGLTGGSGLGLLLDASGNVGIGTTTPTNPLTLTAGSVGTPALSFGDTGTGIYRPSVNQLNFAVNGTQQVALSSSQVVFQGAAVFGNAAARAGQWSGGSTVTLQVNGGNADLLLDTRVTGIDFGGTTASQPKFGWNGTNLYVENADNSITGVNFGIGTTSPGANLAVQGNALISGNLNTASLTATSSISAPFFTGTSATATSTFAKAVLIGGNQSFGPEDLTISPSTGIASIKLLDQGGRSLVFSTNRNTYDSISSTVAFIGIQDSANLLIRSQQGGANGIVLQPSGTGSVYVSSGNLGVGVGVPNYKVDVAGYVNVDQFSGYKQAGNTILYASSTNNVLAIGNGAAANYLSGVTTNNGVIAIGFQAGNALTSAASNGGLGETVIGYQAALNATSSPYSTIIGYQAGQNLGWDLSSSIDHAGNTAIGYQALKGVVGSTELSDTAIGAAALTAVTSGSANVAVGNSALLSDTSGQRNVGIGLFALSSLTTGSGNIGLGVNVQNHETIANDNIAIGYAALGFNTTGSQNVAIGADGTGRGALFNNISATSTVAIGGGAGWGAGGQYFNQGGVFVGYRAGNSLATSSDYNTLLGYQAGFGITTGADNIIIGADPNTNGINSNLTTGAQNVQIGYNLSLPSATANGQLNIQNIIYGTGNTGTGSTLSTGNIGIGTTTPGARFAVQGNILADGITASSTTITANTNVTLHPLQINIPSNNGGLQINRTGTNTGTVSLDVTTNGAAQLGATNNITIAPGGVGNVFVANANNTANTLVLNNSQVGIGGTPAFPFDVNGGTTVTGSGGANIVGNFTGSTDAAVRIRSNTNGGTFADLRASNGNGFFIEMNDTVVQTIDTSNRFGIGTTSPWGLLSVNPTASLPAGAPMFVIGSSTATKFIVDQSGNVGIGTTSPDKALTIQAASGQSGILALDRTNVGRIGLIDGSNSDFNIVPTTNFRVGQVGSSAFSVLSTGNVGIGTTTPGSLLEVVASGGFFTPSAQTVAAFVRNGSSASDAVVSINSGTAGKAVLRFGNPTTEANGLIKYDNSLNSLNFGTNGVNDLLTITSTGAVGVGTTTPYGTFTINSGANQSFPAASGNANTLVLEGTGNTGITLYSTANLQSNIFFGTPSSTGRGFISYNNSTDNLSLSAGGTGNVLLMPNANGNVGIGTSSPGAALDVRGGGGAPYWSTAQLEPTANWTALGLINHGPTAYVNWVITSGNGSGSTNNLRFDALDNTGSVIAEPLNFSTNGSVGIGTTTPGTVVNGHAEALSIYGRGIATNDSSGVQLRFGGFDAGSYGIVGTYSNHPLRLQTNSTDAIVIDTSQHVGIGTTTPFSTNKLQVNGNIAAEANGQFRLYNTDDSNFVFLKNFGATGAASNNFGIAVTGNNPDFLVSSTGKVGIGTTTPQARLVVANSSNNTGIAPTVSGGLVVDEGTNSSYITLFGGNSAADGLVFGNQTSNFRGGIEYNNSLNVLDFKTNGNSVKLRIDSSGNVGIGTTSPIARLDVSGTQPAIAINDLSTTEASGLFQITSGAASAGNLSIYQGRFGSSAGEELRLNNTKLTAGGLAVENVSGGNFTGTDLTYFPKSGVSYVNNGSNFGVGSTSPQQKLDVAGNIGVDQYSGYYIGDSQFIYGSSTQNSIAIGFNAAPWMSATTTVIRNTVIGINALSHIPTSNAVGSNTIVGFNAAANDQTGDSLTAVGEGALQANTSGGKQAAFGASALGSNTTGNGNVGINYRALVSNTTGSNNIAIGGDAMELNKTGSDNVTIGAGANWYNTSATSTVAIGSAAGSSRTGSDGNFAAQGYIVIGYQSGGNLATSSDYNTFIGYKSGFSVTTGAGNILLGANVDAPSATGNNQLNIGNALYGTGVYSGSGSSPVLSSSPQLNATLGVGSTTPGATFAIHANNGSTNQNLFLIGSSTASATTTLFKVTNQGLLQFGGYGAGTLQTDSSGNVTVSSDARLKNVYGSFDRGLSAIEGLNPILFHWNQISGLNQDDVNAGFIAQNVQQFIPEAVGQDNRGYLTLQDRPILAAAVNAIKDLANQATSLSSATTTLSVQVANIQQQLATPQALTATDITATTLTASGEVSASSFAVPSAQPSFLFGSSTISANVPSEVLTATGATDIFKLASYGLAYAQTLATRVDTLETQVNDIDARLTALQQAQLALASSTAQAASQAIGTTTATTTLTTEFEDSSSGLQAAVLAAIQNLWSVEDAAGKPVLALGKAIQATTGFFDQVFAKEVHTDKVCVGETCIDEAQLKQILANQAASATTAGTSGSTVTTTTATASSTPDAGAQVIDTGTTATTTSTTPALVEVTSDSSQPTVSNTVPASSTSGTATAPTTDTTSAGTGSTGTDSGASSSTTSP